MTNDAPLAAITALLRRSEALWGAQDYDGLKAQWDPDEVDPIYVAEEIDHPLIGWPAIDAYWRANTGMIRAIRVSYADIHVKLMTPGLAVALFALRWDIKMDSDRPAFGGDNRVTALFRRKPDGWRYCHYVEAPLSPIVYVRRLYEKDATPAFKALISKSE